MKKDKLYTYGKKGNIFWPGGELNSYGWMPEQMQPIASPVYKPLTVPTLPKYENFGSKNLGTFNIPTVAKAQPLSSETIGKTNNYYNQQVSEDGGSSPSFYNAASKVLSTAGPGLVALGSDGYSTNGVGEGISTAFNAAGDLASVIPGVGAVAAPILKTIGIGAGIIANRGWGVKENKKNTAAIKENTALAKSAGNELGSANTNNDVLNAADNMTNSLGFKASDLYKNGWFTKKGTKKGNALRNQEAGALAYQNHALTTGAENADYNMDSNIMRNFAAFGGPLDYIGNTNNMGAIEYGFMSDYLTNKKKQAENKSNMNMFAGMPASMFGEGGSIEIKHPGRLTELKKRTGKTEAELWAEGKPEVRKMITFARNARKWKKAYGGYLDALDILSSSKENFFEMGGPEKSDKDSKEAKGDVEDLLFYLSQRERYPNGRKKSSFENFLNYDLGIPERKTAPWFEELPTYIPQSPMERIDNIVNTTDKVVRGIGKQTKKTTSQGEPFIPHMKFALGGDVQTNGADFTTGLAHVNAGGSHEENPYEGVQVGVDPEGTPNLVEEGETIFNDYVFSNRIEVPPEAQKRLGVKGKHLTFAEAAKQLEKEIKERANDPISKAGFKAAMEDLEEEQEFVKRCSMYSVGEVYDVDSNELMLLNQNGYEYKKLE